MEGHCCIHSFLNRYGIKGNNTIPVKEAMEISLKLGVAWTTVYRYNADVRKGKYIPCDNCKEK
ncbi:MAG: hypothetical protein ACYC1K_03355 [Minisyncoccota bacterium]